MIHYSFAPLYLFYCSYFTKFTLSFRQQFRAIILKTFFLKKIVLSLKAF